MNKTIEEIKNRIEKVLIEHGVNEYDGHDIDLPEGLVEHLYQLLVVVVQKEREEAVGGFIHWVNRIENHQRDIDMKFWLGEAKKYKDLSQTKGDNEKP